MFNPQTFRRMRLGAAFCAAILLAANIAAHAGFKSALIEHVQAHLGLYVTEQLDKYLHDRTGRAAAPAVPPKILICAMRAMQLDEARARLDEARASFAQAPIGTAQFGDAATGNKTSEQNYQQAVRDYNSSCP